MDGYHWTAKKIPDQSSRICFPIDTHAYPDKKLLEVVPSMQVMFIFFFTTVPSFKMLPFYSTVLKYTQFSSLNCNFKVCIVFKVCERTFNTCKRCRTLRILTTYSHLARILPARMPTVPSSLFQTYSNPT